LWLATLIVMATAALVVIPLFAVTAQTSDLASGWIAASLWPTLPAISVFIPKSDVVYAFVGMSIVWAWLSSINRKSQLHALLAGLLAWCGLMCSLAFLPVFLLTAILSFRLTVSRGNLLAEHVRSRRFGMEFRSSWQSLLMGAIGFFVPVLLFKLVTGANLVRIWIWNYHNHAGFYREYVRTYWKWLLLNPLELCVAAGVPLFIVGVVAIIESVRRRPNQNSENDSTDSNVDFILAIVCVWGLLWLTGKNSGEAARLWIIFLPWLAWMVGPVVARWEVDSHSKFLRPGLAFLILQIAVCILTVIRVSGFHFEAS